MTNLLKLAAAVKEIHTPKGAMASTGDNVIRFDGSSAPLADTSPAASTLLTYSEIAEALQQKRLVMHYQPQYEMGSGYTVAAEALARLVDRDGGLITPDRFIDIAETSDLSLPFGRAVIHQVCADLADCHRADVVPGRIAINLSAHQLDVDPLLVHFVDNTLAHFGLHHEDIEFELTERQRLSAKGRDQLFSLAKRGSRIVLDDIGIGYSSIVNLTNLPLSAFKLDYSLVRRLPGDPEVRSIVKNLLAMAADLGLDVVAEGIETSEQNKLLADLGCTYAQGYGYARPMSVHGLMEFLGETGVREVNQRH